MSNPLTPTEREAFETAKAKFASNSNTPSVSFAEVMFAAGRDCALKQAVRQLRELAERDWSHPTTYSAAADAIEQGQP